MIVENVHILINHFLCISPCPAIKSDDEDEGATGAVNDGEAGGAAADGSDDENDDAVRKDNSM